VGRSCVGIVGPAGPDLVHAHWWGTGGSERGLARLAGGAPYVLTPPRTDVALLKRSPGAPQ